MTTTKKEEEKKTELIKFRTTKNEKTFIEELAKLNGYENNLSDFVRKSVINPMLIPQKTNFKKSKEMVYEINKIGVNLHMITKHCNKFQSVDLEVLQAVMLIQEQLNEVLEVYKKC